MKHLHQDDLMVSFHIWHPRYNDNRVLLDAYRVDRAKTDNLVVLFTRAKSLPGLWYVSRKKVRRYRKEFNGSIECYSVPLRALESLMITKEIRYEEVW